MTKWRERALELSEVKFNELSYLSEHDLGKMWDVAFEEGFSAGRTDLLEELKPVFEALENIVEHSKERAPGYCEAIATMALKKIEKELEK